MGTVIGVVQVVRDCDEMTATRRTAHGNRHSHRFKQAHGREIPCTAIRRYDRPEVGNINGYEVGMLI